MSEVQMKWQGEKYLVNDKMNTKTSCFNAYVRFAEWCRYEIEIGIVINCINYKF